MVPARSRVRRRHDLGDAQELLARRAADPLDISGV